MWRMEGLGTQVLDTGYKEHSRYIRVYQNERPAERLREYPWVLVSTTGCKFTFLTKLGKHCLARLWLTSLQQQCISTESQTVLYSLHNPISSQELQQKGVGKKLKIIQSSTDFDSLLFSRLLNPLLYTEIGSYILKGFPLTLRKQHDTSTWEQKLFISHEEVHSE